uniref:Uncharacterized protein n=1 Tax=Arundo donax TaxID=35708 RepID=A0A0A9CL33_ARUDO
MRPKNKVIPATLDNHGIHLFFVSKHFGISTFPYIPKNGGDDRASIFCSCLVKFIYLSPQVFYACSICWIKAKGMS